MSDALERAIDALSGSDVPLADALRGLVVVSRRIGAEDATKWLRSEMSGYAPGSDLPSYRVISAAPIEIRFDGRGGSWEKRTMSPHDLPDELGSAAKNVPLLQPVAELEALRSADKPVHMGLPAAWLQRFRDLAAENRVPHIVMSIANDADVALPGTYLAGMLDRIKSAALDLVLDIEQVSTAAGGPGGPTVTTDPSLARVVHGSITNIFAHNSNITVGDSTSVASGERGTAGQVVVQAGDVAALLEAASTLLAKEGVAELAQALERDGGKPGDETRTVLGRVRSGSIALAGGVTTNGAYDLLVHLVGRVFPGFS